MVLLNALSREFEMVQGQVTQSEGTKVASILAMDFALIKRKLMDPIEGKGWTAAKANEVEAEYKRFLILNMKHPKDRVVPSDDVDDFWHQHILDTRRYPEDCQAIFGYFFHHYPYFGMLGDQAELVAAAQLSAALYQREFGETSSNMSTAGCNGGNSRCRNCNGTR